jgi:hypothetical protein
MVGSHKILTVSYGTFSCTLEGFEDSFETMKAIAEYFRDLAADDRYFGAEPPVPDVEMLARIAEREVARRVEARMERSGIVLRVGQDTVAVPASAEMPVQNPAEAAEAPVSAATKPEPPAARPSEVPLMPPAPVAPPVVLTEALKSPVHAPAAAPVPVTASAAQPLPVHPDSDSVAAKLQRIRAVVGKGTATALSDDAEDAADLTPAMAAPVQTDSTLAALMAEVRAEVEAPVTHDLVPSFVEEPADLPPLADLPALTDIVTDDALAGSEPIEDDAASAGQDAAADLPDTTAIETGPAEDDAPIAADAPPNPLRARVIKMRRADLERAVAAGVLVHSNGMIKAAPAGEPAGSAATDLPAEGPAMAHLEAEDADPDFIADAAELTDEFSDLDDLERLDGLSSIAAGPTTLSPDDEAELAAELAALEREAGIAAEEAIDIEEATETAMSTPETAAVAIDDAVAVDFAGDEPEAPVSHPHLRAEPELDEAHLSRIVAETDAQLSEPDAILRREAIAQLKAAVAATEAARRLGENLVEEENDDSVENAFRDDLRQVVRPRRPLGAPPEVKSERPKPPPLKLVASQRIDLPADAPTATRPAPAQPIRPRRVMIETETDAAPAAEPVDAPAAAARTSATSFAEFAEEMGATSLADLLEAAAAYTSFVEGSEDFSRPQLLQKVSQMSPEGYNREDGLRSFGTLLREGRIVRSGTGRFVINEETRFNPERDAG